MNIVIKHCNQTKYNTLLLRKGPAIFCLFVVLVVSRLSAHHPTTAWGQTSFWLWGRIQPSIGGGTMSWLWIMWTPSSHLNPHTCALAGLALRATSPGPQEGRAGGATVWETTSAPTALMGFTSGQVRESVLIGCDVTSKGDIWKDRGKNDPQYRFNFVFCNLELFHALRCI